MDFQKNNLSIVIHGIARVQRKRICVDIRMQLNRLKNIEGGKCHSSQ